VSALILFFSQYRKLIYIGTAVVLFGGYTTWVYHKGYAPEHAKFEAYKADIAAQSTRVQKEAQARVDKALADNLALNQQIEADHAKHSAETNALHSQLASVRLRFKSSGSCGTMPGTTSSPANDSSTYVELPSEIERNLRELAYSADRLKDDYAACRAWAYPEIESNLRMPSPSR
jgi:hypothetical protein